MKYLIPFTLSFALTVIFTVILIRIGGKISWRKRRSRRHIHKKGVLRVGGISMTLSFIAAILLDKDLVLTPEIVGMMIGAATLMVVGFWDDIKEIFWKIQLFFQVVVAFFVFILGIRIYYITNPLSGGLIDLSMGVGVIFSVILVIFWILLLINSINWLDGIDGLSGGVSLIACVTIFFLSLKPEVYQPPVAILAAILAGVTLGFLIFNFNPSKILAGTSGTMFLGFSLAVLAIIAGTKIATALLVMAIPIIDLVWVIGDRIKKGRSIFMPGRNHLHYKLMEMGWSQKKIAFSYWGVTLIISIIALNTRAIGKGITLAATAIIMILVYFIINKKTSSSN